MNKVFKVLSVFTDSFTAAMGFYVFVQFVRFANAVTHNVILFALLAIILFGWFYILPIIIKRYFLRKHTRTFDKPKVLPRFVYILLAVAQIILLVNGTRLMWYKHQPEDKAVYTEIATFMQLENVETSSRILESLPVFVTVPVATAHSMLVQLNLSVAKVSAMKEDDVLTDAEKSQYNQLVAESDRMLDEMDVVCKHANVTGGIAFLCFAIAGLLNIPAKNYVDYKYWKRYHTDEEGAS